MPSIVPEPKRFSGVRELDAYLDEHGDDEYPLPGERPRVATAIRYCPECKQNPLGVRQRLCFRCKRKRRRQSWRESKRKRNHD